MVHQHFSASHAGANLVLSSGIPVFTPFIGAGIDRTRLVARSSTLDTSVIGRVYSTAEGRFTAGFRVKPYQFTYFTLAYFLAHGQSGAEGGLGLRF